MKTHHRFHALVLLACFMAPSVAKTPAPPKSPASPSEALQPKFFIWGLLLNVAFKFAMQAFSNWAQSKLTNDLTDTSNMNRILLTSANAVVLALSDATPFGTKFARVPENTVVGEPVKPLRVENGKENYQGVHVAVVGFDAAGTATGVQPVTAGFHTGDRIKLKILPTFDGLLQIENINGQGVRTQIYPALATDVLAIKAGAEILVPVARDEYFEFAGATGDEQLLITIRDPRAFDAAASSVAVNRKDEATGSSFVQETPAGTYPVIAQSLKFKHSK